MIQLILFICSAIFVSCAPNFHYSNGDIGKAIDISLYESEAMERNWENSKWIADYDIYAWKATDKFSSKTGKEYEKLFNLYLKLDDSIGPKVVFGKSLSDDSFSTCAEIRFKSPVKPKLLLIKPPRIENGKIALLAKFMQKAKELNKETLNQFKVPYNKYVRELDDKVIICFMPGWNDYKLISGGGIKTIYNKNTAELVENIVYHKKVRYINIEHVNSYGSQIIEDDIPNEIDFAQFKIIDNNLYPKAILIYTPKYIFFFHRDFWFGKLNAWWVYNTK